MYICLFNLKENSYCSGSSKRNNRKRTLVIEVVTVLKVEQKIKF